MATPKTEKQKQLDTVEKRISELGESKAGPFVERAKQLRAEIAAGQTLADNLKKNSWYLENLAEWEGRLKGKLSEAEARELSIAKQVFEQSGTDEAGKKLVDSISGVRLAIRRRDEIAMAEKQTDIQNRAMKLANDQAQLEADQAALAEQDNNQDNTPNATA